MSLFTDALKHVDAEVDRFFGDAGLMAHDDKVYAIKGVLDRDIAEDGRTSVGVGSVTTILSVQANQIPSDPRGGVLVLNREEGHHEQFDVIDYDDDFQGRVLLILIKVTNITTTRVHSGFPYTFPVVFGNEGGLGSVDENGITYPLPMGVS